MHFYTTLPGQDMTDIAARFALDRVAPEALADAVLLVPTRRATITLRDAFRRATAGRTVLLPRILSLADVGDELLALAGPGALSMLAALPPAMGSLQQLSLLTAQVQAFEARRSGGHAGVTFAQAMQLARQLMELQDRATRAGVTLTSDALAQVTQGDYATHWQQSLQFLDILSQVWPLLEAQWGMTTRAAREVALLHWLEQHWRKNPPPYPVIAVGSTASQPATAALLSTIAALGQGHVILPGLDPRCEERAGGAAHPYHHMLALLARNHVALAELPVLGDASPECSVWLRAMEPTDAMQHWREAPLPPQSWQHVTLVPAAHAEEEARAIALLLREGLENRQRVALVTPDEGLMARVDAQLKRFGLTANRLSHGTLGTSPAGSAYLALLEVMDQPEAVLPLINALKHPLVRVGTPEHWAQWLGAFEQQSRGTPNHAPGQLPKLPPELREQAAGKTVAAFARQAAELAAQSRAPSHWVEQCRALLNLLMPEGGQGQEPVEQALDQLAETDDIFAQLDLDAFAALLREALAKKWRAPQFDAHPGLIMLTPVEARLQHFDRVVLGNMQESLWPGLSGQSPWLNRAQQDALGLPGPEDHAALMAHDVLLLGSCGEVFLSWPQRDGGSPTARSRFIERLLTLLAVQGAPERSVMGTRYLAMARAWDAAERYEPASPPRPAPAARPSRMAASAVDLLFSDPYALYARYLLQLSPLDAWDAELEPRDFGTLAHRALKALSEHWTEQGAPGPEALFAMAETALAPHSQRPAVRLFWQHRLVAALQFVNAQEALRRTTITVDPEFSVKQALPGLALTLEGKIDRLEQGAAGAQVVDYKTGKAASAKDIENGKATQLLAYAMMLQAQEVETSAIEYWELPRGGADGKITRMEWDGGLDALAEQLYSALAEMLEPATPFLARPLPGNDRMSDYDGISRYDEWAG